MAAKPALAALLAGLLALSAPAAAPAQSPDLQARMAMAPLARSERLRLRAWGDGLEARALSGAGLQRMRTELHTQGYGRRGLLQRSLSLAPVLTWDDNINGGVLQDRFSLNGWIFHADPAQVARAGVVGGARGQASLRYGWSEGRTLQAMLHSELAWSPRHKIGRADLTLQLCALNHLTGWQFLDACLIGQRAFRQRSHQSQGQIRLSHHQIRPAFGALHDLELGVSRHISPHSPGQNRLTLGVESLWRFGTTDFSLTLGEGQPDQTLLRRQMTAGVTLAPGGKPWRVELSREEASGGRFLGRPRADLSHAVRLTLPVRQGPTARIGLSETRSTAVIAESRRFSLDLRFANWRWR